MDILKQIKPALLLLIWLTILTGIIYPLLITGIAQLIFPFQANGSIISDNHQDIGSILIGQNFTAPYYFWGRASATSPFPYNAANSSGSNLGPTNPALFDAVKSRIKLLQQSKATNELVPIDLVTTSGSGLDPDISPLAAYYQSARIAKATHLPKEMIDKLIDDHIQGRTLGILGEPRVNVLTLNIALNKIRSDHVRSAP